MLPKNDLLKQSIHILIKSYLKRNSKISLGQEAWLMTWFTFLINIKRFLLVYTNINFYLNILQLKRIETYFIFFTNNKIKPKAKYINSISILPVLKFIQICDPVQGSNHLISLMIDFEIFISQSWRLKASLFVCYNWLSLNF